MIQVKPFRAYRPSRDKASLVATRSYLTYSDVELDDKLNNNPYTFLHIINPRKGRSLEPGPEKYGLVKESFALALRDGIFQQDDREAFYLYRQIKDGNEYIGLIAAVAVEDYLEGRIKKHEKTLTAREEMFTDYLEATGFNAEPVLLTYQDDLRLDKIYARYVDRRSEYEFTSTDRVLHQLWLIDNEEECTAVETVFREQGALYIADGHHRCASSAGLFERKKAQGDTGDGYHHFMAFLIGEEQMKVYDFNRLVVNDTGKERETILQELSANFLVEQRHEAIFKPEKIHEIGMYMAGSWFKLMPKTGTFDPGDPISHLDAEILSVNILDPVFHIKDLKLDQRVDFIPGTEGLEKMMEKVDRGGYDLAFALHPVSVEQIKRVSDKGLTMPPKSTYVEPKLRSGLTVYPISS